MERGCLARRRPVFSLSRSWLVLATERLSRVNGVEVKIAWDPGELRRELRGMFLRAGRLVDVIEWRREPGCQGGTDGGVGAICAIRHNFGAIGVACCRVLEPG